MSASPPSSQAWYQRAYRKSRIKSSADIASLISDALESFGDGMADEIDEIGELTAEKCAEEIRNYPVRFKGKTYLRGWTSQKDEKRRYRVTHVVYNRTQPQLAHLLEFGHDIYGFARREGGRTKTREFEHIAPVNDRAGEIFQEIMFNRWRG